MKRKNSDKLFQKIHYSFDKECTLTNERRTNECLKTDISKNMYTTV